MNWHGKDNPDLLFTLLYRGTSMDRKAQAFRRWFYNLGELRSLVPKAVPVMAITATATAKTKAVIKTVLHLQNCVEISQSPNKPNITYSVQYMDNNVPVEQYFGWLVEELRVLGSQTERTIVYCQTIKQCSMLYSQFSQRLGGQLYSESTKDPKKRRVEMLHSLSPKLVKDTVLLNMSQEDGSIRVLICTIAFGMGVNCRAVHRIVHFGPSKSVEAYVQETGRAGRDGQPSTALLLYKSIMLLQVDKDMRDYVKGNYHCRREFIMKHFDHSESSLVEDSTCCDCCSKQTVFKVNTQLSCDRNRKLRKVSSDDRKNLKGELIRFRKTQLAHLIGQVPNGELPVLSVTELLVGFSDVQINQALENAHQIFNLSDVKKHVEIWKGKHAMEILEIFHRIFSDMDKTEDMHHEGQEEEDLHDDEDLNWNDFMADPETMDMDWDNLSYSNLFPGDMTEGTVDNTIDSLPGCLGSLVKDIDIQ